MEIQPYKIPSSRAAQLRTYYELKSNEDLVLKQIDKTMNSGPASKILGVLGIGFLAPFIGSAIKFIGPLLNIKDNQAEKDRIVRTFNYMIEVNGNHYTTWHTQTVDMLEGRFNEIQADIQGIIKTSDRGRRRYLPVRLHMASGLARIIAQHRNKSSFGVSTNEARNYLGFALAGLAAWKLS
jgi:hypothetical protein